MNKYIIAPILLLVLMACGREGDSNKVEEKVKLVRYTVIEKERDTMNRRFAGKVISDSQFKLGFRVNGTLEDKYVKLGDKVKKGEILARLDNDTYNINLKSSEANYETAKANLVVAKTGIASAKSSLINANNEYERIEQLYFEDSVSKSEYDTAKANNDIAQSELSRAMANETSAKSSIENAREQVNNSRLQLSYTNLVSSIDGYIVSEEVEVEETVSAGTPIYIISPTDDLKIVTALPETLIRNVRSGDSVEVSVNTIDNTMYKGSISEIGKSPIENGSNYPVQITLDKTDSRIKSGMSTKVYFQLKKDADEKIFLPLSAITEDHSDNLYVYKIVDIKDNIGVAKKTIVKLGDVKDQGIEVTEGINNSDYIITAGITQILEGQKVRLPNEEVK